MKKNDADAVPPGAELRFDLAFRDRELEDTYLEHIYRENRKWVLSTGALGVILLFGFAPWDLPDLSAAQNETLRFIRVWIWGPGTAVGLVLGLVLKKRRPFTAAGAIMQIYSGFCLGAAIYVCGAPTLEYILFIILLFAYFMSGMPLRLTTMLAIVIYAIQAGVAISTQAGEEGVSWAVAMGVICSLMTVAAYRFERISRQNFVAQRRLQAEYGHRLAIERDRVRWLETIAGFLRHELKNAMTGIGSSLLLVGRTVIDAEGSKYLERAQRSLAFMRRFFAQAAEATSMETALAEQEFEPVNLSQLVEGRVHDYAEEYPDRKFVVVAAPNVLITGSADRLVQMLDKLVNNAVEHGAAEHPIEVALRTERERTVLSVKNIGDALPENVEWIFEPFVSQKLRREKTGNLGLGLYVARAIAIRHGGTVTARRLQNPDGAELIVELP
jgi:signal transduction histidine kinase